MASTARRAAGTRTPTLTLTLTPTPTPTPTLTLTLTRCGWDKTFCLNFLPERQFPTIHFFGDKTLPGGGDYELYSHARTVGHAVDSPEETISEVRRLFL